MAGRVVTASDFDVIDLGIDAVEARRVDQVGARVNGFPGEVFVALNGNQRSEIKIGDLLEYTAAGVRVHRVRR